MDYEDEEGKKVFSGNTITIVSGVIALIILSAVVSAYPNGMEISGTHDVVYSGSENMVMAGKIGIKGSIGGIVASNVSGELFSGVGEIIVRDGSSVKTFFNGNVSIAGGNSGLNLTIYVDEKFGCAAVIFDTQNESVEIVTRETMNISCSGDAVLAVENSNVSVGNGTWKGSGDFVITLKGGFNASMDAKIFGLSRVSAMNVSVGKGSAFDDELLDEFDIELPPLPFDFNGFFAASGGGLSVDGNSVVVVKNFSFFRGAGTAVVAGNSVHIDMKAVLVVIDGDFYSTEKGTILWFIPNRIIGLWPIAIAVWVIASLVKKRYMSKVEDYDKGLSGTSVVIHVLGFVISSYLWDREIRYIFGRSILSALANSVRGGFSVGQWVIVPFEMVPWLAVLAFISLPVSIILSSVFGLIGFERLGKGVGKATGMLLLFFAGIVYISFFLNITLSPLVKGFMGF